MNRRFVAVPVLAAAAFLALAACNSGTTGTPTPIGGGGGLPTPTSSDSAPTSTDSGGSSSGGGNGGGSALSQLNPCNLVSSSVAAQLQLTPNGVDDTGGGPGCDWEREVDANGLNGYSVGVTIRATQGVKDTNNSGATVTTEQIGGHQSRQLKSDVPGDCIVAIGVTDSSRVDVTVNAGTNTDQACQVANQVAQAVAPELPTS